MSQRTAKFVSAIFASLLAGTPLATVSHGATDAADSCLSKPKGASPAGGHWYYRIDRATKRHCWYIGDEKEKLSRAAPENSPPAANSVSLPNSATTQRSIANARAELPLRQTRVEQETTAFTGQRAPATAANAMSPENDQRANAGDASAQRSVVASRWPELAGVSSPASPGPSAGNSGAGAPTSSEAASPVAMAAVPLAAADASSTEKPSGSVQMLLIAIVGALALAGLLASAIVRFGGTRRSGRRNPRVDRRAIWDSARTGRPASSDDTRAVASMRELDLPRDPRTADDPNQRIAQMLARLARSAAT